MSDVLDLRGLSCPRPVMEVRKVLERPNTSVVKVLVDSPVARDNIGRTAQSLGWNMMVDEGNDGFVLILERIA